MIMVFMFLDVPCLSTDGFWTRARKLQILCATRWSKVSSCLSGLALDTSVEV